VSFDIGPSLPWWIKLLIKLIYKPGQKVRSILAECRIVHQIPKMLHNFCNLLHRIGGDYPLAVFSNPWLKKFKVSRSMFKV